MSKRKSRKKRSQPNIPQATLERARQQAGLDPEEMPEKEAAPAKSEAAGKTETPKAEATEKRKSRRRNTSGVSQVQLDRSKKRGEVDADLTAYMLQHPNKQVSNEELQQEYGFVLRDLRNMGVLAAALMVLLVVLAQAI